MMPFSQWLPQAGIGLEFRGGGLHGVYCKRSWKGFREADRLEIPDVREAGPQEAGRRYREFLRKHGLQAPWTVVALPRSEVLLRVIRLPKTLRQEWLPAVHYQLEALHPFGEGGVGWDCAIWNPEARHPRRFRMTEETAGEPQELTVLVAMAQREYVEELSGWLREAQIPVSQFCPATLLLLKFLAPEIAARLRAGEPYFLLHATETGGELIGCAAGKGLVSREIPLPEAPETDAAGFARAVGRELDRAKAELRLAPDLQPQVVWCGHRPPAMPPDGVETSFRVLFPALLADAGERIVGMAAGFAAVQRGGPLAVNLLPEAQRTYEPPLAAAPTYALAALVALLALGMALRGSVQDWIYSRYLERERQALLPAVEELQRLQERNQDAMAHLAARAEFRRSAGVPLALLEELTRLLPPEAWLQQLQYDGSTFSMSGTAPSASAVLQAVSSSVHLEGAQFSAALTRTPEGKEVFRIGARLRAAHP